MRFDFNLRTRLPDCGFCGLPIRNHAEVKINGKLYHPNHIPKEKTVGSSQQITRTR
jgi:hypothetical protein